MEVDKIWGKELWLLNDSRHKYCHKKLILDKGAVGSLHYHNEKIETLSIEKGIVKMECGEKTSILKDGDTVTIVPGVNHRFSGIVDSIIFETSSYHEEGDLTRIEKSYVNKILYGVDVDGTLMSAGGKIEKKHLDGKEFVIISSRSVNRSKEACDEIGINPLRIMNCRVLSRAEEMIYIDSIYPIRPTTYLGDMESDKKEALRAGWKFMYPDEFIEHTKGVLK